MKKILVAALSFLLVGIVPIPSQASEPGLSAEVFKYSAAGVPDRNPDIHTRCSGGSVITEVATLEDLFGPPWDESFAVAGCRQNLVLVYLSGYIDLEPGDYTFTFTGDDGQYLKIGDQVLTTDAVDWILKPPNGSQNVPFTVQETYSLSVDFWFFDNEYGSFSDVLIKNSQGVEVPQAGLFSKTARNDRPNPAPYEGPLNLRLSAVTNPCAPATWRLTGQRLETIREIRISGELVTNRVLGDGFIDFAAPALLPEGKARITYEVPKSNLTLYDYLTLSQARTCEKNLLKVSGLGVGSSVLTSGGKASIASLVASRGTSQNQIVCVGSATANEGANPKRIARARAVAACQMAVLADPTLKPVIFTTVRKENRMQFRAVTLKLS